MGGNYYGTQNTYTVFSNEVLTANYADTQHKLVVAGQEKISLDIDYARGAGEAASKLNFKIEHSTDEVNWFSLVIDETSTTSIITPRVWELNNTNKVNVIVDIAYKVIRISAIESGVVTNAGTLSMTATTSGL